MDLRGLLLREMRGREGNGKGERHATGAEKYVGEEGKEGGGQWRH